MVQLEKGVSMKQVNNRTNAGGRAAKLVSGIPHEVAMALLAAQVWLMPVSGQAQEAGADNPVLVVNRAAADDTNVIFNADAIAELPRIEFTTTTPWTMGTHSFSGPSLLSVLREAQADGTNIRLEALNGYSVELPVEQLNTTAPIVADRIDGRSLSIRDKGPLWVVYPYDSDLEFQTEVTYARSVWQLVSITVLRD